MTLASVVFARDPACAAEAESLPSGDAVAGISIFPTQVELKGEFEYRQLVITAKLESGATFDITRLAKLKQPSKCVAVSPSGFVTPLANGEETLAFELGERNVEVKVSVRGFGEAVHPSFVRDVQPALSRMGCNQGTCHGANTGKAGFKLSLRGYDALFDYQALTDDLSARRFNRAAPDQSLFLLKATGSIPHVGGVRTPVESPYYKLLANWIADGVKLDLASPRVVKIEVFPSDPVLSMPGQAQQMAVLATYSDGAIRDVTREAFIESGDIEIIESVTGGALKTLRRGEAPVLARYEGAYAATTITIMGDRRGFTWQDAPSFNYVDDFVYEKLRRVKILPSPLCTDDEFLRRVSLDLTGLPPSADAVREFLADTRETRVKREELVDRLIDSNDFVQHWTNKWADLLQVNRKFLGPEGSLALRQWIEQSISEGKPYDQFAYQILTAQGSNLENPPAAYFKVVREPDAVMENTTHLFLAVRFNCNKCHDHPFERWTQDQYYQLSAFFAQVERKEHPAYKGKKIGGTDVEGAKPLVETIADATSGDVKHLRTGAVAPPTFPYSVDTPIDAKASRREQLARWIISSQNQYFARSYVNRLWGYLFGRGIIEPIDDIRAGNPPTNPALLNALAADFVNSGFNVRHMLRTLCNSRAYQHSISTNEWNADDTINYSHAVPRRLPAEVLFDSIHRAAGSVSHLQGVSAGMRAAQLPDAGISDPFLDDFGRPPRESACECERTTGVVLGPVMKLINGPTVANALADANSELTKFVAKQPDDSLVVKEIFLRFLGRSPTEAELKVGMTAIQEAGEDSAKLDAELKEYEKSIVEKQAEWEKMQSVSQPPIWKTIEFGEAKSLAGATLVRQSEGSYLVEGKNAKDVYTLEAKLTEPGISGFKLEVLPHPSLGSKGPGRAPNGNFVLNELRISAAPLSDPAKLDGLKLVNPTASFSQDSYPVQNAVDGKLDTGWAIHPQTGKPNFAVFGLANKLNHEGGSLLRIEIDQRYDDGNHQIGHFRIQTTTGDVSYVKSKLPDNIADILSKPADQRSPEARKTLANYYANLDTHYQDLVSQQIRRNEVNKDKRMAGVQDLAWALINSPAFLFNR